jgi:signal transduction histidine kinase
MRAFVTLVAISSGLAAYALVIHRRAERARQANLRESARREGAQLTARTLRHHLANKLAVTAGYSELLADDPRLPLELEQQAEQIRASAMAAVETVDKLQRDILQIDLDTRLAGPPLIDLEASTRERESPKRSQDLQPR